MKIPVLFIEELPRQVRVKIWCKTSVRKEFDFFKTLAGYR